MIRRLHAHPVGNFTLSIVVTAALLAAIISVLPKLH